MNLFQRRSACRHYSKNPRIRKYNVNLRSTMDPPGPRGGGGTSLWVRRGCAPVLGSFWPENSGIGVSFYWKISVIGVYFHSEFSGIGGYSKFCNGC